MKIYFSGATSISHSKKGLDYRTLTNKHLTFHDVHGENIQIFQDGREARRVESFCKGICFSGRPVVVGEPVIIKISRVSCMC